MRTSLLDKLERAFGRYAIVNLSIYIVIGQAFVLFTTMFQLVDPNWIVLVPARIAQGEWWRVVTFPFFLTLPTGALGPIFTAFALYMFYMMGNALESYWGSFRYNLFLLLGFALTVGAAFITPNDITTNAFLAATVFLAFAYLNPEFEFVVFFVLPVKVKWLALISWAILAASFVRGDGSDRWQIVASVGNFMIFFGGDLMWRLRHGQRALTGRVREMTAAIEPRHRCCVCGKTDLTNPEMDFRYCSKCVGDECYCPDHIRNHVHAVEPDGSKK